MNISDLDFPYPDHLVATERRQPSRIMMVNGAHLPVELADCAALADLFAPGDCLVINETRVLKRRVFSDAGLEILFLKAASPLRWDVLCPSSRWKDGTDQLLPGGIRAKLVARGRIQTVETSEPLDERYFEANGDLPLPPYIQKARGERKNRVGDEREYQTAWAKKNGSLAAPTASLHFSDSDLARLEAKGVRISRIVLHVGLGTFLPITAQNLDEHQMHSENVEIPESAWQEILKARERGGKIWALGTTVVRSLEAAANGHLEARDGFRGETDIFIRPGYEFRVVDRMLTNFHQPRSTLLALVAAFAGLENVKAAYAWAIEKNFRLFSYGDLTVWIK